MAQASESQSSGFDASTLDYLRERGVEVEYGAGEVLVRQGEVAQALYVVLAGEVEFSLGEEPHRLTLCRLGPSSTFGEASVLRGLPLSADVVAASAVRVLRYPGDLFPRALAEHESLTRKIVGRLAKNLHRTTADAWELFRRSEALQALARHDGTGETMLAASARTKALLADLEHRAARRTPVLLTGEEGTGKMLAARTIHDASSADGPFIVVDCGRLPAEAAADVFGSDESAEASDPPGLRIAPGGSLVLADIGALPAAVQRSLAAVLGRRSTTASATRVLATSRDAHRVVPELAACFPEPLELPPLRQRGREILPLARHFLEGACAALTRERRFTPEAERVLVSLRYRCRNVAELRDIVELAARCAEDREVRAEHIFAGIGPEAGPIGVAVRPGGGLDRLLRSRVPALLRGVTLAAFLSVIGVALGASASAAARTANGFIWSVWEPVVFALFLFAGPVWCAVCPLSTAGRLAQRIACLARPVPAWLKSRGAWLGAAGLLFILWVEKAAHMVERPAASALLLLGLLAASVLLCMVFRREVWCRHVCPLGRLAVAAAPAAPVTLAAHQRVCSSTCTSHECYRGTVGIPGCTVFHHPQLASQSHNCKLCLDCLRTCPHHATTLYLRPPLSGARDLADPAAYVVPFALAVFFLSPLFLATERGGPLGRPGWLAAAGTATLVAAWALARILPRLLHGDADLHSPAVPQAALGLAILGWGPLLAFELGHVEALARLHLVAGPELNAGLSGLSGIDLQAVARVVVMLVTALAAAVVLRRARRADDSPRPGGWRAVMLGTWLYVVGVVALLL